MSTSNVILSRFRQQAEGRSRSVTPESRPQVSGAALLPRSPESLHGTLKRKVSEYEDNPETNIEPAGTPPAKRVAVATPS